MAKIVVIGSCSVDFTTYTPRLPKPGETLHGTKFCTSFGGKGANQCVAAAKLGGNTTIICRLGDDYWGQEYKEQLRKLGVDVSNVTITPNIGTGIAQISVAEDGENQIVIVAGANGELSIQDVENAESAIKTADILIGQMETPFETTLEAFKLCSGIKLLNVAPACNDIEEIFPYTTILCVNESEASLLTNMNVDSIENAVIVIKKLLATGCQMIIVTLGEKGAVYATKEEPQPIHVPCEPVTPVDTTGAGDAFVGALATFLVTNKALPMHQIIGAACQVATASVTKEGTQTSYPTRFDAFTKKYKFDLL